MLSPHLPIPPDGQLICATLLTGVYDVNRNQQLAGDQPELIEPWCASIARLQLTGFVFHNSFSEATIEQFSDAKIHFIRVEYEGQLNPNVYRYLIYDSLLQQYSAAIKHLFVTDISDVEVVQNPFEQALFQEQSDCLFCGDEPSTLDNEWMRAHGSHLRQHMAGYAEFESQYQHSRLLNCGVIGGTSSVMSTLMAKLAHIHRTYTQSNQTPYTLDMGAFNYVARTEFGSRLQHGPPVNTLFKGYEQGRNDCWFRHK